MSYSVISITIGVIGVIISGISLLLFLREKRKNRTIYWKEVSIAANHLSSSISKDFLPDIILIPNEKGGIIAEFLKKSLPVYTNCIFGVGIPIRRVNINKDCFDDKDFFFFKTQKWYAYIPKCISSYKDKKILIVDDFAMTGDFLLELKKLLVEQIGFNDENIKTVCLATTEYAIANNKGPDYYWKKFDTPKVYLPWGKPE